MQSRWLYRTAGPRKVLFNLSYMLKLYGAVSVPPAVLSAIYGEFILTAVFAGTGLVSFLAGTLSFRRSYPVVNNAESLVIVALSYVLYSLLGALPFLTVSSYMNGFFEAMSGFTTTGLTMFDPEGLPRSLVFFRSYSQWIGGAGIVILSSAILRIPVRAASRIVSTEAVEVGLIGSMKSVATLIIRAYVVLTAIGLAALAISGMDWFDSLVHALSAISTGGFSSRAGSIGAYGSPLIRSAVILVMILGSVNFTLYHRFRDGERRRMLLTDPQVRWLLGTIVLFAFLNLLSGSGSGILTSLFHSATSLTTTGFDVDPVSGWPEATKLLSSIQMIIGGGDASTAGGIKLFRLIVIVHIAGWFIRRALLPRSTKTAVRYGDSVINNTEMKEIFAFFSLYLLIVAASTIIFAVSGHTASDSFFESASSLGTVGLSSGITGAGMPPHLKVLLIFNMWAGRIEILPVLVMFNPFIWRKGRKKR